MEFTKVCSSRRKSQKSFILTIPWNLANFVIRHEISTWNVHLYVAKNISWMAVLHKPVHIHKFSRSLLPASLFEHMSMGQVCHPPTQWTTLCVQSVLSCPLWPCNCRMRVIAKKRLGCLHWLAHATRHGLFQGASTSRRTASFVFLRSPQKTKIQKFGGSLT